MRTQGGGPRRPRREGGLLDDEMDLDRDAEPPVSSQQRRNMGASTFGPTPFAPLAAHAPDSDFGTSSVQPQRAIEGVPSRPLNTEELFDVQQQSDFFISLGQHDQAIAVLREHIAANPGTSALAYLDLLRIYHSLGRKEDHARLAEEFERVFNAVVPAFEHFNETGKGLEHYRSALARIESQWPAPATLALIEELVFRKPGGHEDESFDLAAYQELLLLYSVAKEVIDPAYVPPSPVTPHSFADTFFHGDESPTAPAPVEAVVPPEPLKDGPTLPASLYGAIDEGLKHETVMSPEAQVSAPVDEIPARARPDVQPDFSDFDKTAYETMPTPLETPKPRPPSTDPHVIDFELFDPGTEEEIAPRPIIKR